MKNLMSKLIPSKRVVIVLMTTFILGVISFSAYQGISNTIVGNWDVLTFSVANPSEVRRFRELYTEKHVITTTSMFESLKGEDR